jgi:hypothetical protein
MGLGSTGSAPRDHSGYAVLMPDRLVRLRAVYAVSLRKGISSDALTVVPVGAMAKSAIGLALSSTSVDTWGGRRHFNQHSI